MVNPHVHYSYLLLSPAVSELHSRSLGALSGGLLKEIADIALPAGIRRTVLYRTMVGVTLKFLIEDVGEVEDVYPSENHLAENFILQRTASHGIELLGILAFRASPVWVLAALADVTGGGQKWLTLREISAALQEEGLLEGGAHFKTMDQVLTGLEKTSSHLALTLNLPPMDVPRLRLEWQTLKTELRSIPPNRVPALERLERTWEELKLSDAKPKPVAVCALHRCWPYRRWPTYPRICSGFQRQRILRPAVPREL